MRGMPKLSRQETADLLVQWAIEAGFDRAGIATLEPIERGEMLLRWLERGDHAGMEWLARKTSQRIEPNTIFPGARSALCVSLRYHPLAGEGEVVGDLWPKVARYARGRDYHEVMGERLIALEARIAAAFPAVESRRYVDTGPVLERELAARAGLGAIGKNTLLLHPKDGSYFLLGEIFLSLDLTPSEPLAPIANLCGRCTRCLDACPTGALAEPYHLDARRCISYWTIEHRGDFPPDVPDLDGWVFGCDVCQEVCPWNRKPVAIEAPEFALPETRRALGLVDLLALPRERYVEIFRGSPMKRAKLEGLQRNAQAALDGRVAEAAVESVASESEP